MKGCDFLLISLPFLPQPILSVINNSPRPTPQDSDVLENNDTLPDGEVPNDKEYNDEEHDHEIPEDEKSEGKELDNDESGDTKLNREDDEDVTAILTELVNSNSVWKQVLSDMRRRAKTIVISPEVKSAEIAMCEGLINSTKEVCDIFLNIPLRSGSYQAP